MRATVTNPGRGDMHPVPRGKRFPVTDENKSTVVTVFGSSMAPAGDELYRSAERLGRMLAERGARVASGGYGGVMEAVSRGARAAGRQARGR